MKWVDVGTNGKGFVSPPIRPYLIVFPPPPPPEYGGFNLSNTVNPSILLIIIILAVIFFVSGLVHLLVRILLRPSIREADDGDNVTALQGQLQQLFHLHDSGVDQSFIDALPVFNYKAIIGVKDPFDCAVCLCEFEAEDKLRLLPKCSHAFHMDCIDTWLLSHSTCPLCRASLLPDFSQTTTGFSPVLLVLESRGESSREMVSVSDREQGFGRSNSIARVNSHLGSYREDIRPISGEIPIKTEEGILVVGSGEKVVQVKLGKFKNVDGGGGECSSNEVKSESTRRCFSMGSFAYVMDENSSLQVPIRTPAKRTPTKKPSLPPLTPGHRHALSECGSDSGRRFNGLDAFRESFSISKNWLRGKQDKSNPTTTAGYSRRAVSFHFPAPAAGKNARRTISEIQICRRENEVEFRNGNQISFSPEHHQLAKEPSFARRTLLWFIGKPNRAVHSFSRNSNV